MSIKKHIPNAITLLNAFCGGVAVIFILAGKFEIAAIFFALGITFDFLDGFLARILDAKSELGLQLDSLADMVTSGVVPGLVMFQLFRKSLGSWDASIQIDNYETLDYLPFFGLLIIMASVYRLAKFNIDENQTSSFIGLPTPANTLFIFSLPLMLIYGNYDWVNELLMNRYVLIAITLISSYLLNSPIRLFGLKFSDFSWKNNTIRYLFIIASIVLLILFKFVAVPLIIFLYILLSFIKYHFIKSE
jgi:CDP-diacylglycerol--serine O-phosphatidyltransferase